MLFYMGETHHGAADVETRKLVRQMAGFWAMVMVAVTDGAMFLALLL